MQVMPEINQINQELEKRCDEQTIFFLNVNDKMAGMDGNIFDGITIDNLHLSVKGYQVWADGLKPILTKLLGPPAATDHAPAPTGDPSASRPDSRS